MWRYVVPVVIVLVGFTLADVQYGENAIESVQRLKRSPHYDPDCPPNYYHHHPSPPPPPPFWPPPPPPYGPPPPPPYWPPPPPPPPPPPRQEVIYVQEQNPEQNEAYTQPKQSEEPCTNCQSAGSNAISNAHSENGQAIAIAVARAKSS